MAEEDGDFDIEDFRGDISNGEEDDEGEEEEEHEEDSSLVHTLAQHDRDGKDAEPTEKKWDLKLDDERDIQKDIMESVEHLKGEDKDRAIDALVRVCKGIHRSKPETPQTLRDYVERAPPELAKRALVFVRDLCPGRFDHATVDDVMLADLQESRENKYPSEWDQYRVTSARDKSESQVRNARVPYHFVPSNNLSSSPLARVIRETHEEITPELAYDMFEEDRRLKQDFLPGPASEVTHLATFMGAVASKNLVHGKINSMNASYADIIGRVSLIEHQVNVSLLKSSKKAREIALPLSLAKECMTRYNVQLKDIDSLPRVTLEKSQSKARKKKATEDDDDDAASAAVDDDGEHDAAAASSTNVYKDRAWLSLDLLRARILRPRVRRTQVLPFRSTLPPWIAVPFHPDRYCEYNNEIFRPISFNEGAITKTMYTPTLYAYPVLSLRIQLSGERTHTLRIELGTDEIMPVPLTALPGCLLTNYSHDTYDMYDIAAAARIGRVLRWGQARSADELVLMNQDPFGLGGQMMIRGTRQCLVDQQQKSDGVIHHTYTKAGKAKAQTCVRFNLAARYELGRLMEIQSASTLSGRRRQSHHQTKALQRQQKRERLQGRGGHKRKKQRIPESMLQPKPTAAEAEEAKQTKKRKQDNTKRTNKKKKKDAAQAKKAAADGEKGSKSSKKETNGKKKKGNKRAKNEPEEAEEESSSKKVRFKKESKISKKEKTEHEDEEDEEEPGARKRAKKSKKVDDSEEEEGDEEDEGEEKTKEPIRPVTVEEASEQGHEALNQEEGEMNGEGMDKEMEEIDQQIEGDKQSAVDTRTESINSLLMTKEEVEEDALNGGDDDDGEDMKIHKETEKDAVERERKAVLGHSPLLARKAETMYRPFLPSDEELAQARDARNTQPVIPLSLFRELNQGATLERGDFKNTYSMGDQRVLFGTFGNKLADGTERWTKGLKELLERQGDFHHFFEREVSNRVTFNPLTKFCVRISEYIRWNMGMVFSAFGITDPKLMKQLVLAPYAHEPEIRHILGGLVDEMVQHHEGITSRRNALIDIGGVWLTEHKNEIRDETKLANNGLFWLVNKLFDHIHFGPPTSLLHAKLATILFNVQQFALFLAKIKDENFQSSFLNRAIISSQDILCSNFRAGMYTYKQSTRPRMLSLGNLMFLPQFRAAFAMSPDNRKMMQKINFKFITSRSKIKSSDEKTDARQSMITLNFFAQYSQLTRNVNRTNARSALSSRMADNAISHGHSSTVEKSTGKNGGRSHQQPPLSYVSIELTGPLVFQLRAFVQNHPDCQSSIEVWIPSDPKTGNPNPVLALVSHQVESTTIHSSTIRSFSSSVPLCQPWLITIDDIPIASAREPQHIWQTLWNLKTREEFRHLGLCSRPEFRQICLATKGGRPLRELFIPGHCPPLLPGEPRRALFVPPDVARFFQTIQSLEHVKSPIVQYMLSSEEGIRQCVFHYQRMLETGTIHVIDVEMSRRTFPAPTCRDLYWQPRVRSDAFSTPHTQLPPPPNYRNNQTPLRARDMPVQGRTYETMEIHPLAHLSIVDCVNPAPDETSAARATAGASLVKQTIMAISPDNFVSDLKAREYMTCPEHAMSRSIFDFLTGMVHRPFTCNQLSAITTLGSRTMEDPPCISQLQLDGRFFFGKCLRRFDKMAPINYRACKENRTRALRDNPNVPNLDRKSDQFTSSRTFMFRNRPIDEWHPVTLDQFDSVSASDHQQLDKMQAIDPVDGMAIPGEVIDKGDCHQLLSSGRLAFRRRLRRMRLRKIAKLDIDIQTNRILQGLGDVDATFEELEEIEEQRDRVREETDPNTAIEETSESDMESVDGEERSVSDQQVDLVVRDRQAVEDRKYETVVSRDQLNDIRHSQMVLMPHIPPSQVFQTTVANITSLNNQRGLATSSTHVSSSRHLGPSDKIQSFFSQKGVMALPLPVEQCIHTVDGAPVHNYVNPHGEPTRQTGRLPAMVSSAALYTSDQPSYSTSLSFGMSAPFQARFQEVNPAESVGRAPLTVNSKRHMDILARLESDDVSPQTRQGLPSSMENDLCMIRRHIESLQHCQSPIHHWRKQQPFRNLARRILLAENARHGYSGESHIEAIIAPLSGILKMALRTMVERNAPEDWHVFSCQMGSTPSDSSVFFLDTYKEQIMTWTTQWTLIVEEQCQIVGHFLSRDMYSDFGRLLIEVDAPEATLFPILLAHLESEIRHYIRFANQMEWDLLREMMWSMPFINLACGISTTLLFPISFLQRMDLSAYSNEEIEIELRQLKDRCKTILYSGVTGCRVPGKNFVGFLPFQRILKPAEDYLGALKVSDDPPRDALTRQPTRNRDKNGAICEGYMDKYCYEMNEATVVQHHRSELSDQRLVYTCDTCGQFSETDNCFSCKNWGSPSKMVLVSTNQWAVNQQAMRNLGGQRYALLPDHRHGHIHYVPNHLRLTEPQPRKG